MTRRLTASVYIKIGQMLSKFLQKAQKQTGNCNVVNFENTDHFSKLENAAIN
jgi:hypothetical protein